MLDTVAKLSQNAIGYVAGTLADKINPHAFGANEAHDLLNFLQQVLGAVPEQ